MNHIGLPYIHGHIGVASVSYTHLLLSHLLQLVKGILPIACLVPAGLRHAAQPFQLCAVEVIGCLLYTSIISPEGLILTKHHCGYVAIQQHSSVEHDYLTDGFWAMNRSEELPTPGLKFRFVHLSLIHILKDGKCRTRVCIRGTGV